MPQSPSRAPSSPKRSITLERKTARSMAFNTPGNTLNDNMIVRDPSIVSIKNPRYPPSQTAEFVHATSSILKEAPSYKSPSSRSISSGFKMPMMQDSTRAVKLSGLGPSPPAGESVVGGSAASGPSTLSGPSPSSGVPQSSSVATGKAAGPSDSSAPTATTKQTDLGATPEGQIELPMSTGIKLEFAFATLSGIIFLGLWCFLMTANCYNNLELIFWVETFSLIGAFTGLLVAVYCCFERNLSPRSGMTGCLFLTSLVVVISLNLIGAYLTVAKCICKCEKNALKDGKEDLWITIMEVVGSALLIVVLMVASVSSQRA